MARHEPDSRIRDASRGESNDNPCRLYCTHTTFAESVLEDASGDDGAKVLGYSVRASSLDDRAEVRGLFRTVERYLSYELPCDTLADEKEHFDAASAPRRLFFVPAVGKFQIFGQICYRSHDTAGRPGSYFADVVVAPLERSAPVSARDVVQLWAANADGSISHSSEWWCDSQKTVEVREKAGDDRPFIPCERSQDIALGIRRHAAPIISDKLLLAFLNCETEAEFSIEDPAGVIPGRWHTVDRDSRRVLMARLLRATVDVAKQKDRNRARVVIAVEPSVAALLFYGALRLLPDFTVRQGAGLSFSTYEPAPERATMNLVATTFQRGEASHADLPGDMRCFSCNTFRRDPTVGFAYSREATDCEGDYAAWCVDRTATGGDGLATIDELRTTLAEVVPEVSAGALDLIVAADREVHSYLEGRIIASPSLPAADEAAAADANAYRQHLFKMLFERHAHHGGTLPHDIVPVALKWLPSFHWGGEDGICDIVRSEVRRLATNPAGEKWLEHVIGEATPSLRLPDPLAIEAFVAKAQVDGCLPSTLARFMTATKLTSAANHSLFRKAVETLRKSTASPHLAADILRRSDSKKFGDAILAVVLDEFDSETALDIAEDILSKMLASRSTKEKWDLLVNYGKLAKQLRDRRSVAPALRAELDSLFDGQPESDGLLWTPAAVAGKRLGADQRERRTEALTRWAELTTNKHSNCSTIDRWKVFFNALNRLTQRAEAGNRLLSGKDRRQAIDAVAKSLSAVVNSGTTRYVSPPRLRSLLTDAVATQPIAPDTAKSICRWTESAFNPKVSAGGRPKAMKTRVLVLGGALGAVAAIACVCILLAYARAPETSSDKKPESSLAAGDGAIASTAQPSSGTTTVNAGKAPASDNPAAPEPSPAAPVFSLSENDIALRHHFEDGKLVLQWDKAIWDSCSRVTLERGNDSPSQELPPDSAQTTIDLPLPLSGELRLAVHPIDKTAKPIQGVAIKLSELKNEIEQGLSLGVTKARLVSSAITKDSPEWSIEVDVITSLHAIEQRFGKCRIAAVLTGTTPGTEEIPLPDASTAETGDGRLRFMVPLDKVSPTQIRDAQVKTWIETDLVDGPPSTQSIAAIQDADIRDFMKMQAKLMGVAGVAAWQIPASRADDKSASKISLHPSMDANSVTLRLLLPEAIDTAISLDGGTPPDGEVWKVRRTNKNTEAAQDAGSFKIDRSNAWRPVIAYEPPELLGDDVGLAIEVLRASKLCVLYTAVALKPTLVFACQLRQPWDKAPRFTLNIAQLQKSARSSKTRVAADDPSEGGEDPAPTPSKQASDDGNVKLGNSIPVAIKKLQPVIFKATIKSSTPHLRFESNQQTLDGQNIKKQPLLEVYHGEAKPIASGAIKYHLPTDHTVNGSLLRFEKLGWNGLNVLKGPKPLTPNATTTRETDKEIPLRTVRNDLAVQLSVHRLNNLQKSWRLLSPKEKEQQLSDLSPDAKAKVVYWLDRLLEHDERTRTDELLADCTLTCDDWCAGWWVGPWRDGLDDFGGPRVIAAVCAGSTQASAGDVQSITPSRKQERAESDR